MRRDLEDVVQGGDGCDDDSNHACKSNGKEDQLDTSVFARWRARGPIVSRLGVALLGLSPSVTPTVSSRIVQSQSLTNTTVR